MRKRNANGNDRHASNAITVSSAVGTPSWRPRIETSLVRWLRNATGSSQPSRRTPQWFTTPNCGLSMVFHTYVAATTGATYGSSIAARTSVRPRNGLRRARVAMSPMTMAAAVPSTE